VAIIVIATLAVFLLPKILTGYNSSADFGLRYGPRAASSAFLPSAWGA
jgi:hypothetical protein